MLLLDKSNFVVYTVRNWNSTWSDSSEYSTSARLWQHEQSSGKSILIMDSFEFYCDFYVVIL